MQNLSKDEKRGILGEVLMDELKAIREYVQKIPDIKACLGKLETKFDKMEENLNVVKAVVRDHETELGSVMNQLANA